MKTGIYALLALLLAGLLWLLLPRAAVETSAARPDSVAETRSEPPVDPADPEALTPADRKTARVAVLEPPAEPATDSSPAELAHVRVTLVEAGSGATLAGVPVWIDPRLPEGGEPGAERELYRWMETRGWGKLEGSAGQPYLDWGEAMPRTDEKGLCRLPWPCGVPFRLLAGGPEHDMSLARREERALVPGEDRALTLELTVGADFVFHGRVLSAALGTPVAGAEVYTLSDEWRPDPKLPLAPAEERRHSEYLELVDRSDEDGRFALGGRSWKERSLLEDERVLVVAEGFGPTIVGVTRANATPEEALSIRLAAAAEVRGQVSSLDGPGVVELTCVSGRISSSQQLMVTDMAVWSAAWEQDGSFLLEGLPPGVALEVRLRLESGEQRVPSQPITLGVGESRVVDWVLGGAVLLRGVVVDEHGAVVAHVPVAAVAALGPPPPSLGGGVIHMFGAPSQFAAQDETDAEGRFELPGLDPGPWAVGVVVIGYPPDLEVSATGTLVEIPVGARELEARVSVFRELSIHGVVRAPDEQPLAEVHVTASSVVGGAFADGLTDAEGRFELDPLAPGAHRVSAWAPGRLMVFPALEEVEAGARDVVLQGHLAGGLWGRVFQPDGTPTARVQVRLDAAGTLDSLMLGTPEGRLELSPLPPGSYDLVISSPAKDALALTWQVVAGELTELPDMHLEPAGRLLLKVGERAAMTRATLRATSRSAGTRYPVDLWPGQNVILTLPPGTYELELPPSDGMARGRILELVVRAGEEQRIELESRTGEGPEDRDD